MKNLVDSSPALVRELDAKLQQRMKEIGDSWSNDWLGLPEDAGRLYRHRTFYTIKEYEAWARENPAVVK